MLNVYINYFVNIWKNIMEKSIAILIPCYNEEKTIKNVILDFKDIFKKSNIYVYDNNSTDNTAAIALDSGAIVRYEKKQGKGNVVQRMFSDIDADIYLLVDGDSTYDPLTAPTLVDAVANSSCEMAVASRNEVSSLAYRTGHKTGNTLLTGSVNIIFGKNITDMLSGYRAMSKSFVKTFPILSSGFEIETEITIHALGLNAPVLEFESLYSQRPENSESKLQTYSDGWKILILILRLFRQEKPLVFFSLISVILAVVSIGIVLPILSEYYDTGLVNKLPTAILSMGIMLVSIISFSLGLILDTVTTGRSELKKLFFLNYYK